MEIQLTKTCTKCKKEQPLENFGSHPNSPDKKKYWCKSCFKIHNQSRYEEKKDKIRDQVETWQEENPKKTNFYKRAFESRQLLKEIAPNE